MKRLPLHDDALHALLLSAPKNFTVNMFLNDVKDIRLSVAWTPYLLIRLFRSEIVVHNVFSMRPVVYCITLLRLCVVYLYYFVGHW